MRYQKAIICKLLRNNKVPGLYPGVLIFCDFLVFSSFQSSKKTDLFLQLILFWKSFLFCFQQIFLQFLFSCIDQQRTRTGHQYHQRKQFKTGWRTFRSEKSCKENMKYWLFFVYYFRIMDFFQWRLKNETRWQISHLLKHSFLTIFLMYLIFYGELNLFDWNLRQKMKLKVFLNITSKMYIATDFLIVERNFLIFQPLLFFFSCLYWKKRIRLLLYNLKRKQKIMLKCKLNWKRWKIVLSPLKTQTLKSWSK